MKYIYVIIFSLISMALIACSADKAPNTDTSMKGSMSRLDKETKALIGTSSCSSDNQCHSLGFGHKACGGFFSYRIYSDQNTDVSLLKTKVNQYNALSRKINKNNNLVSDCMMLMKPQLACRNQRCQIK